MRIYHTLRMQRKYPLLLIVALLVAWGSLPIAAQNATISPSLGNLISAYTHNPHEVGFEGGYGSLWQHKQLPITYSCSEEPVLSKDGVLGNHTCNFLYYTKDGKERLIHVTGVTPNYSSISMPKGYKITGYKIVIKNNLSLPSEKAIFNDVMPSLPFERWKDWTFGEVDRENIRPDHKPIDPIFRNDAKAEIPTNSFGKTFTIERHAADMGHILYFCFAGNTGRGKLAAFTYESIELWFTANNGFEYKLSPRIEHDGHISLSENDMPLGKTDMGELKQREKRGKKFYSYDQYESREMTASVNLYEEGAHDGSTWDASQGNKIFKVVNSNDELWYALQKGTYFVEAPTTAKVSAPTGESKVPVGYRIVGIKVDYKKDRYKSPGFLLKATRQHPKKPIYLDSEAKGGANQTVWHRTENDEIYTLINGKPMYLWHDKIDNPSPTPIAAKLSSENKHVKYLWHSGSPYFWVGDKQYYLRIENGNTAFFHYGTQGIAPKIAPTLGSSDSNPFRIKIYGPTGKENDPLNKSVDVGERTPNGFVRINGYNNDAVKFKIEELPGHSSPTALVNITVIMETLNPYIKSVDVVCHGAYNTEQVRTFDATDFNLGGEKFVYRVPKGFSEQTKLKFTFRNLKSDFADNTYKNNPGTHNSRYSFVASDYYNKVNDDLYTNKDVVANYDYKKKIAVDLAGNIAFPFNNAGDLSNKQSTLTSAYFTERQFTMEEYTKMTGEVETNINGVITKTTEHGKFAQDNTLLRDNETKTMYLYTTDETRYNIAPTKKEQHRAFAYYHTVIKLEVKNYEPKVKWIPLYNNAMYYKDAANKHYMSAPLVGAEIQTTESGLEGNKHQQGATSEFGYLTLNQIVDVMQQSIAKGTDPNVPHSLGDVLFVDNSKLFDIIRKEHTQQLVPILEDLRSKLAKNALIYLPYRAEQLASVSHTALQRTDGKGFEGHTNIELTDKLPFYAPYDIQLKPEKYATYTRDVTVQGKGRVNYATLVLPYGLTLDGNGMHSNAVGTQSQFYLAKMRDNSLVCSSTPKHEGADYEVTAKLKKLEGGNKSEANVPYIVNIAPGYGDGNISFVATEKGALIKKTPGTGSGLLTGYAVNCTLDGHPIPFKSYYTYSGRVINKSGNEMVFYFSLDRFVAFKNLKKEKLFLFPFRSVFHFENHGGILAKAFNSFGLSFDGDEETTPTSIEDVQEEIALKVTVSEGQIKAEARKDAPLNIYTVSGQCVTRAMIKTGETRTFYLAPGVYLVNGKKMIVN